MGRKPSFTKPSAPRHTLLRLDLLFDAIEPQHYRRELSRCRRLDLVKTFAERRCHMLASKGTLSLNGAARATSGAHPVQTSSAKGDCQGDRDVGDVHVTLQVEVSGHRAMRRTILPSTFTNSTGTWPSLTQPPRCLIERHRRLDRCRHIGRRLPRTRRQRRQAGLLFLGWERSQEAARDLGIAAGQPRIQLVRSDTTSARFSAPSRWNRFINGCSSALIVIYVNDVAMVPSSSPHSRHNPATEKSESSRIPMA